MRINKAAMIVLAMIAAVSAAVADNNIFMEYGVMYAAVNSPGSLEDNTTGVYDTVCFDARLGANLYRWVNVYGGGSFMFFPERQDSVKHYTFFPLYVGFRANILPDMVIYPDFTLELGKSISNYHSRSTGFGGMPVDIDRSYTGDYYNIGFGINWNMHDVSSIALRIERPSIAGSEEAGEIHFIKAGIAWKTYY